MLRNDAFHESYRLAKYSDVALYYAFHHFADRQFAATEAASLQVWVYI